MLPMISLVVSTLGRTAELEGLLDSLQQQEFSAFEVIIVDQNDTDLLSKFLQASHYDFPIEHIRTPGERGISRGRNIGWRRARADILVFPDDDCWYPPWFLQRGMDLLQSTNSDFLSGRSADETGRSINGRYASKCQTITKRNVWVSQMEWASFVRKSLLTTTGGYDEDIGTGSAGPWQAAEGPDLILRALACGFRCSFDPSLYGHHLEFETGDPSNGMIRKGRVYARGMGYVLRKHGYGIASLAYWLSRSLFNVVRHVLKGDFARARFYFAIAVGRLEGWRMKAL